jgi:hypothetical protein
LSPIIVEPKDSEVSMTFGALVEEVIARGYDYMSKARIESFVRRSYQILCSRFQWPFLEAEAEGTAPLEIENLRYVLSVTDKTNQWPLHGADRRWLAEAFPNLEEEGLPQFWYLENNVLQAYPLSSVSEITVRYVQRAAALLEEGDEPVVPGEWQYLIVDMAVVQCLKDNDEYQVAAELKGSIEEDLRAMISDQLQKDFQRPRTIQRSGRPWDYL